MAKTKVSTLNLRIEPGLKEAVREAAAREHRSVANMVEMLIRRHCDQSGITIPAQDDFFPGTSHQHYRERRSIPHRGENTKRADHGRDSQGQGTNLGDA